MNPQHHQMIILERTHPSGTDEWYCPTCGRRILMKHEPKLRKEILAVGDDLAFHSGGNGGLRMGSVQIVRIDVGTQEEASTKDARLAPWEAWLDEMGFENLWNNDVQ
ncbi:MAG TPA: hypothetical protein VFY66_00360 [Anaerolineales bacterium]|nr:hypothetical protein [Anaerolineales bacterium]